jgi:hypothetical protein
MLQPKNRIPQYCGHGQLFPEYPESGAWLLAFYLLPLFVVPIRSATLLVW